LSDVASGRLGRPGIPVSGEDPVGDIDAGGLHIFEVAHVVIADRIDAGCLLASEEGVSFGVDGRVPIVALDDVPGAEVAPEAGNVRDRA
jgi:hypothetical protein